MTLTAFDHADGSGTSDAKAAADGKVGLHDRKLMRWGAPLVALVILVAAVVSFFGIRAQLTQVRAEVGARLQTIVAARAEIIGAWANGIARQAEPIADSYLFRLYATEIDLAGGDLSRSPPGAAAGASAALATQREHFDQMLLDVTRSSGFSSAWLVGRDGVVYAADPLAAPLNDDQRQSALRVQAGGAAQFGAVRAGRDGPEVEYVVPVTPPQPDSAAPTAVAAFVFTLPVARAVADFLASGLTTQEGGRWRLLQARSEGWVEVTANAVLPLVSAPDTGQLTGGGPMPPRPAIGGGASVYAKAAFVTGPQWWIAHELPKTVAESPLRSYIAAVALVASLAVVVVLAAFGTTLYRYRAAHERSVADRFRSLAEELDLQQQFLASITDALTDAIGLKDAQGRYVFVNPAFAKAVGRPADDIMGLDDEAIYGHGTAQRLNRWDDVVRKSKAPLTAEEEVFLASQRHILQISKVPCRLPAEPGAGILSVSRDITEITEHQRLRERAQRQIVAAFVRAVELRDAYLAGHSRRLAELGTLVAKAIGAPPEVVDTVEAAANLSQIGKMGVRRELLTKSERLTPAEIQEMEKHVDYAAEILRGVEFELPVLDAIMQMNERLDGSGYPAGLEGDDICLAARILSVCDVFCARIEARAYRAAITPAAAIDVLARNPLRYDPEVVRALRGVVSTVAGEKVIASVEA